MTEAPKPSRTLTVIQHAAMKRREALLATDQAAAR